MMVAMTNMIKKKKNTDEDMNDEDGVVCITWRRRRIWWWWRWLKVTKKNVVTTTVQQKSCRRRHVEKRHFSFQPQWTKCRGCKRILTKPRLQTSRFLTSSFDNRYLCRSSLVLQPSSFSPHQVPHPNPPDNFTAMGCFPLRSTNKRFRKTEMKEGVRSKKASKEVQGERERTVGVGRGGGGKGTEMSVWGEYKLKAEKREFVVWSPS